MTSDRVTIQATKLKVFILGLDAATLSLMKPWADEGKLPTIKRLLDEGVSGNLKSTIPPVTAPSWSSFMTGKNPGKHGLYHFIEPNPGTYEPRYSNARSRLAKSMWRNFNEAGLTVGVVNVPMTFPPETVDGYMISGMDAPEGSASITHPPELYERLEKKFGKVSHQIRYLGNLKTDQRRDTLLDDLKAMDDHYFNVASDLMETNPVDVMMLVFTSIDTVQHFFWHHLDTNHPQHDPVGAKKYRHAILEIYQHTDAILAKFLDKLSDDTAVMVMSDHGSRPTSARILYVNRFLADLGVLKLNEAKQKSFHPSHLVGSGVKRLDALLRGILTSSQKAKIARWLPGFRKKWESQLTGLTRVNWKDTKAFAFEVLTFPANIWINRKGAMPLGTVSEGAEYEELIQLITQKLYELKDPLTGRQLIPRVYRKEEIYQGPFLDQAPDLTLAWWDDLTFLGKPSFGSHGDNAVVAYEGGQKLTGGDWGGGHSMDGIVVLWGKPFNRGTIVNDAEIIDLAPTLFYLLGMPIPDDMDGKVLLNTFTEQFSSTHKVTTKKDDFEAVKSDATYSEEDARLVEERLRGLGYLE